MTDEKIGDEKPLNEKDDAVETKPDEAEKQPVANEGNQSDKASDGPTIDILLSKLDKQKEEFATLQKSFTDLQEKTEKLLQSNDVKVEALATLPPAKTTEKDLIAIRQAIYGTDLPQTIKIK